MNSGRKLLIASLLTLGVIVIVGVIIFYAINDVKSSLEEDFERKTILWGFKCENEKCVKYKLIEENKNELHGLSHCRVKCDQSALLWPLPRKYSTLKSIKEIDIEDIDILMENESVKNNKIWKAAQTRFENIIYDKSKTQFVIDSQNKSKILIHISVESDDMKIDFETDESYKISTFIEENSKKINLKISAKTFFGARHGLETISQLIFYDEVAEIFLISLMEIEDSPSFKHRGISVDTSRNFFSIEALKRNINGMAMVKMNRFHWHISDSQSFPFLLKSHPDIAINSAYSMDKIYTNEDVREVIEFGKVRGIQVFIEIDMPGHIGEGFANKNLTSCFGHTLDDYCKLSKPCGQLDPSIDEVYQVLEDIFSEIYSLYDGDISIAHLGGDEVFFECWNSSLKLQSMMKERGWELNTEGFMEVWGYFQKNVETTLQKAYNKKVPIILWSSTLTQIPYLTKYLNKDDVIIQMWTSKSRKADVEENLAVLDAGYKVIVSNYDTLYLDCGFSTFVRNAPDWCAPYHNWMEIYDNRMEDFSTEKYIDQVIGAEAAIWSEQISEYELDGRIWPRLSSLAERLWTDPDQGYRKAEARMLYHREQLVELGDIQAAAIQPEWCHMNQGICPK